MSKNLLANGRGRWLAILVSLVVSAAMLHAQGAEPARSAENPAQPPASQSPAPVAGPVTVSPTEAELLAASAPVDARVFDLALPEGIAPEGGLQIHTIWAARAIAMMFPEITTIGGCRGRTLHRRRRRVCRRG